MRLLFFLLLIVLIQIPSQGQDAVININAGTKLYEVSPYIYGKNGCFDDDKTTVASAADILRYKDAGVKFTRENSGNNATKYNWRKKLASHPDWYNNVYKHDWDKEAKFIQTNFPGMQVMYAFQLLGKVAANNTHNFNDWAYNGSQWWTGVSQNLAGGGTVNSAGGSKALIEGNPDLYLMDWPADSTTKILDHWFGNYSLGFDKTDFQYWSMDNEPEIWSGTHDDVMPTQCTADQFMNLYFDVALKAKQKYPGIKLCGPVVANEWQWFKYASQSLKVDGQYACWLEYFIKKAVDKEKETGVRVLDVVDIHFYPYETGNKDVLQLHRVYYDQNYVYPGANGVKTINGGWDTSLQKEYIFKRINVWIDQYFGKNSGVGIGLTEFGTQNSNPNINAVLYASMLGTFANNNVKLFSPWFWKPGMWETLHLFSRYAKNVSIKTESSIEETVSGYSTMNTNGDSLTLVLVNRDENNTKNAKINLSKFSVENKTYSALQLSSLPSAETFVSHTNNALTNKTGTTVNNSFSINLPPLSVTAVLLSGQKTGVEVLSSIPRLKLYPNPVRNELTIEMPNILADDSRVSVFDLSGKRRENIIWSKDQQLLKISTETYDDGVYFLEIEKLILC